MLFGWLVGCTGGSGLRPSQTTDLVGILVTPDALVVPLGSTVKMTATGLYDDRRTEDLTAAVEWASERRKIVGISNGLDAEGELTGRELGETRIWAQLDGVKSSRTSVVVTDLEITELRVTPESLKLAVDQQVALTATATFSDGSTSDATGLVRWVTADSSVAGLDGAEVLGTSVGSTSVTAQFEDRVSPPVAVEVVEGATADAWPPDLVVDTVDWISDATHVYYWVEISNYGDEGAGPFWVDLYVDENTAPSAFVDGDAWEEIGWIGPWDTVAVEFLVEADCLWCWSWVQVDSWDEVAEGVEDDNVYGPIDVWN